jgi:type IV pilus assembly protein PilW
MAGKFLAIVVIGKKGFTLIEVLVAAGICGFVLLAIHSIYGTYQKSYAVQGQVSSMQQNLRGAISCMERDIRLAGYDPLASGNFGISDVRLDANGHGTITFTQDDNFNGAVNNTDANGIVDNLETIQYSLYDYPTASPDGITDLGRRYGANRQLVAENIEALGFAYAFDSVGDHDNSLDRDINGHVIWAIDSDHDNDLDVNLDTDNDGDIDSDDNPGGKPLSHADNGGLKDVKPSDIRAVRIWVLARGDRGEDGFVNTATYVVSNQRITPKDGLRRRLLTATVRCRNMNLRRNN